MDSTFDEVRKNYQLYLSTPCNGFKLDATPPERLPEMVFQLHVMDSCARVEGCTFVAGFTFQLHVMDSHEDYTGLVVGILDFQLHVMDSC